MCIKLSHSILKFSLVLLLPAVLLAACKEATPDGNYPEPSNKNYWSKATCKIDGKDWGDCFPSPFGPIGINESRASAEWFKNFVGQPLRLEFLNACDSVNSKTAIQSVFFNIKTFNGKGRYTLDENNSGECHNLQFSSYFFRTYIGHTGVLDITVFDTVKKEISGSFQFQAFNPDSNRIIKVTDGQFSKVNFITQ